MNFPRPGERGARDCVLAITSRGRIPWKLARIARLRHNLSSPFPPLFSCSSFSKLIRCYWSVPNRSISNKTCALLTRAQRKKKKKEKHAAIRRKKNPRASLILRCNSKYLSLYCRSLLIDCSIVPILLFLFKKKNIIAHGARSQFSIIPSPPLPPFPRVKMVSRPQLKRFHSIGKEEMLYFPIDFFYTRFRIKSGKRKLPPSFLDPLRKSFDILVYSPESDRKRGDDTRGNRSTRFVRRHVQEARRVTAGDVPFFAVSSRRNERRKQGEDIAIA